MHALMIYLLHYSIIYHSIAHKLLLLLTAIIFLSFQDNPSTHFSLTFWFTFPSVPLSFFHYCNVFLLFHNFIIIATHFSCDWISTAVQNNLLTCLWLSKFENFKNLINIILYNHPHTQTSSLTPHPSFVIRHSLFICFIFIDIDNYSSFS